MREPSRTRPLIAAAALLGVLPLVGSCRHQAAPAAPPTTEAPSAPIAPETTVPVAAAPAASPTPSPLVSSDPDPLEWEMAVARVEELRGGGTISIPSELQHYDDKRRFLAIQIADAQEESYHRPHDQAALAQMIQRGELQELPVLGTDYMLYEVGTDAHENPLAHFDVESGRDVPLFASAEDYEREVAKLGPPAGARAKADRELMESYYRDPERSAELFAEHKAITGLAADFGGMSYDLRDPADSQRFQQRLLSFLRPEARATALALAHAYHERFGRLLPISSLVRTERYQRRLARTNHNATHVDIPPHTTGMAFDVSYKYMAPEEQNLVMSEVARLEDEGKLEALRERNNSIHVFTFGNGHRPPEEMIANYLADVAAARPVPVRVAHAARGARARRTARAR